MNQPDTDADKLMTLAIWFDVNDAKRGIVGSEVQQDLRRIARRLEDMDAGRSDLLSACQAWVKYFDDLSRNDEPGDRLAEARNKFHRARVEMTRAAIARATEKQS